MCIDIQRLEFTLASVLFVYFFQPVTYCFVLGNGR
jgi:hypothetical protein